MESVFFDSVNYDRMYNSAEFVKYFANFIGNGVFADPADGMQVYAKGGMVLGIKPGKCWINGRAGYEDGMDVVTLGYGESGAYRYDAVVARLDLNSNVRDIHIDVIRGDEADSFAEAVKPLPMREGLIYDLVLAYVKVGEGATSLDDTVIIDMRPENDVCGFVTGVVKQFSSSEFFRQYTAMLDDLLAKLGADDHITIDTADHKARNDIFAIKTQMPYGVSGLFKI